MHLALDPNPPTFNPTALIAERSTGEDWDSSQVGWLDHRDWGSTWSTTAYEWGDTTIEWTTQTTKGKSLREYP